MSYIAVVLLQSQRNKRILKYYKSRHHEAYGEFHQLLFLLDIVTVFFTIKTLIL